MVGARRGLLCVLSVFAVFVCALVGGPLAASAASHPSCSRVQARLATSRSPLGEKMQREVGSPLDSSIWGIAGFHCAHLRKSGETDMVVEFLCCTANSPTPIGIFRPGANGRWHLSYSWAGEPPVYRFALRGRRLTGRTPVYNGGPLCCPVGSRPWSILWNGHRWVVNASYSEGRP